MTPPAQAHAQAARANPSRTMGPLVWLDMDQKALDDAYDQMVYAPNRDQVHKRNQFNSDRVRARLGAPKRLAYGAAEIEKLDLFATGRPNAPISIFIHGGAWRARPVKDYAFLAEMVVRTLREPDDDWPPGADLDAIREFGRRLVKALDSGEALHGLVPESPIWPELN